MWLRLAAHGPVGFIDQYQAVYRRHSSNMSQAYLVGNSLPDVQQRKAALDCFFQNQSVSASSASVLRTRMNYLLSLEAVDRASGAFNDGEHAICEQLLEFAASVYPGINASWAWKKVSLKRRAGTVTWPLFRRAFGTVWSNGRKWGFRQANRKR